MEITFTNNGSNWVAEFEVRADFNIHLERDTDGRLDIYQKTAGEKYEYVNEIGWLARRLVYDNDFTASVYPKTIKIVSAVKPTLAVVTMASSSSEGGDAGGGEFLELHLEIPVEDDFRGYTGYIEGDYSEIYNSIAAFFEKNKVDQGGWFIVPQEVIDEKSDITVNEYKVWQIAKEDEGGFSLELTAPMYSGGGSVAFVYPTYMNCEYGKPGGIGM